MAAFPEPFVSLLVNGVDVGSELAPYLIDFAWTDNLHGKADEIAVTLRDDTGLWRGAWRPEQGDIVTVPAIGYRGGAFVPAGLFQVDIPSASGSRGNDTLKFRAISAFPETTQRTLKSKGHENTTLEKIIQDVGGRHGLTIKGAIEAVNFVYKRQRRERDLEFIKRLAEDFGHFVSIKDGALVFFKREDIESQGPVRTLEISDLAAGTRWSAKEKTDKTYSKARVRYLKGENKRLITQEVQDLSAPAGDTLEIDERVEDEDQAKKLAKSRLAKANEDRRTARVTVIGDPLLIAGQVIALGSSFGKYAGNYLTHVSKHRQKRANYTTALELKGV
ncbi:hypothetical protein J7481_19495 [Labrenzia sp. R4_2]|uniref:phage late control D family protein n=1 Tax=Labrenzia sp. R4_2 TaxID=2821107 RepID=UPI001ADB7247|nr:contractile injection system protein, VgrG/Pvc8 family [Labrenzia sp. R4_2]MBO9421701.1 hypothetical protein [Labrenzia sp. R4_2]